MVMFSYLLTILAAIYWMFRVAVVFTYSIGASFVTTPWDMNAEIIILFITLFSFIFIVKRNALGTLVYFACYGWYFGTSLYNSITSGAPDLITLFFDVVALSIAVLVTLDIFFNKNRKHLSADKTNWFFRNKNFDRDYDDRADKNQYKF